ncbi:type II toxin-antitoxin system RelE/ParE family toxin [Megamonas hypermegale]
MPSVSVRFVHKFKINSQQYLLAYTFDPATLTLIFLGVHENYTKKKEPI